MVNDLCSDFSSQGTRKHFTLHSFMHALLGSNYIVATASLGVTDRNEAAVHRAAPGPLTTVGNAAKRPKDTMTVTGGAGVSTGNPPIAMSQRAPY